MTLEDAGEEHIAGRQRRIERLRRAAAGIAQCLFAGSLALYGQKRSPYIDRFISFFRGGVRMRVLIAGATGAIGRPLIRA